MSGSCNSKPKSEDKCRDGDDSYKNGNTYNGGDTNGDTYQKGLVNVNANGNDVNVLSDNNIGNVQIGFGSQQAIV